MKMTDIRWQVRETEISLQALLLKKKKKRLKGKIVLFWSFDHFFRFLDAENLFIDAQE